MTLPEDMEELMSFLMVQPQLIAQVAGTHPQEKLIKIAELAEQRQSSIQAVIEANYEGEMKQLLAGLFQSKAQFHAAAL